MSGNLFDIPNDLGSAVQVRDFVVDWLRKELVGPAPGHPMVQCDPARPELRGEEVLRPQDPPRYRYGAGILFPMGVTYSGALDPGETTDAIERSETVEEDEQQDQSNADDGGGRKDDASPDSDEDVEPAFVFLPSTMGISFLADLTAPLVVELRWATYEGQKVKGYGTSGVDQTLWFRRPDKLTVTLEPGDLLSKRQLRKELCADPAGGSLALHVLSRPWGDSNSKRLITVTMMNTGESALRNEACFFQCGFEVACTGSGTILPYPDRPEEQADDEELSLRLLYRHRPVYAVGHGCAADWQESAERGEGASSVRTEVMPVYEQAPIAPLDAIAGVDLSMRRIAEASDKDLLASCTSLAREYANWIREKRRELADDVQLTAALRARGGEHLDQCDLCLERVRDGVRILGSDPEAMEAFRLMNRAMVEQRAHYALASEASLRRSWTEQGGGLCSRATVRAARVWLWNCLEAISARIRADEPRRFCRSRKRRSQSRGRHMVSHGRRQNRSLSWPCRIRDSAPAHR